MKTKNASFAFQRFQTADDIELCGLYSLEPGATTRSLIHIHGLAGNFYEQLFVDYIAAAAIADDRKVLLFNNRGHDYMSDAAVVKQGIRSSISRGGAHERLAEASLDIEAAVAFVKKEGATDVVISAHSTGAVKAALYCARNNDPLVKGLILLSPSDDIGMQMDNLGPRFEQTLAEAKERIRSGRQDELMPPESFFYPVDAQAFVDLFDPAGDGNVFDFGNVANGLSRLGRVTIPTFVILGGEDIAVVGEDKAGAARKLLGALGTRTHCEFKILQNAGHDYAGHEGALRDALGRWLAKL